MTKTIITALLALAALTGQGQTTQTATIKGYSPALKDSTVAECIIDNMRVASDTVFGGRFTLTVPVEKLTDCYMFLIGEGCPNYLHTLFLSPNTTVELTGTDCLFPLWNVNSPIPEQQTLNRITAHRSDALKEYLQLELANAPWEERNLVYMKALKQTMDILPSLPVDAASLKELEDVALMAKNTKDFPYTQQLKELEASTAARAPKGFEQALYLHRITHQRYRSSPVLSNSYSIGKDWRALHKNLYAINMNEKVHPRIALVLSCNPSSSRLKYSWSL